jgi:hypothetical protein
MGFIHSGAATTDGRFKKLKIFCEGIYARVAERVLGSTPGLDATIPNSSSNGGRSHANGIELHQGGMVRESPKLNPLMIAAIPHRRSALGGMAYSWHLPVAQDLKSCTRDRTDGNSFPH